MHVFKKLLLLMVLVTVAAAQSPKSPLSDTRLSVNTLVREDIFAGLLEDNMERFTQGEKNIALLLEQRPGEKATLIAWSALTHLYRAVRADQANNKEEFQQHFQKSLDLFAEAKKLGPNNGGVHAITGGSYVVLADRLPKQYRAAAWSQAYDNYKELWKVQAAAVEQLPLHFRGELLAGLAQSAQRTGHAEETAQFLDKILAALPNTPYESVAKQWKAKPDAAANSAITCLSCHNPGRLSARLDALK